MSNETLRLLTEKLREKVGDNAAYQDFLNAIKNAEERMAQLHAQDRYGRVKKMTKDDSGGLMGLLKQVGLKAEDVYKNEADAVTRQLVKKITALAAGNHRALLTYDPDREAKTLPTLLREVRTLTLDTRGATLKTKVGGSVNTRQPLTFLDDKGREITGVFTPKKTLNVMAPLREKMDRLADRISDPVGKELVRTFLDRYIAKALDENKNETKNWTEAQKPAALQFLVNTVALDNTTELDQQAMERVMTELFSQELNGGSITGKVPKKVIKAMGEAVMDASGDIYANLYAAHMPDGARIDTRNSAMSAVADLLGVPNAAARSRPMKLILPDGTEVEGTFMAEAKGLDPRNLSEEANGIDGTSLFGGTEEDKQTVGKGMKALADLQVLDYLCGNVDRHQDNMLYQFNGNKKFCGVQGIDNDCSFGILKPGHADHEKELCSLNDMRAISESTYRAVQRLTPEELRFCLRGFDLTEEELNAACFRLNSLKEKLAINKAFNEPEDELEIYNRAGNVHFPQSVIRLVKDKDWTKVKYRDLQVVHEYVDDNGEEQRVPYNVFTMARSAIQNLDDDLHNQKDAFRSLRSEVVVGSGNRAIPSEQAKEAERAKKLSILMDKRTTQGRSSPEYDAMQEAMDEYAFFQRKLKNRIAEASKDREDPDAPYESVVTSEDLEEMRRLAKNVQLKAKAYLDHKGGGYHRDYASKRIEAARLAYKLGEDGAKLNPEEVETSERNMKQALEEVNRRVGDKLEASQWEPGRQSPFEKTDFDAVKNDPQPQPQPQARL